MVIKMKKKFPFHFKSIYVKFAVIFLTIWWCLNGLTFSTVMHIVINRIPDEVKQQFNYMPKEFKHVQSLISITFLSTAILGTIVILFIVRGIVKPIKRLSAASKEVAKGNFDVQVEVKSTDEVGRLSEDFNTMVSEIRSLDTMRKDFVSNVSHEFKTPTTSIKGFAKLISEDETASDDIKEYSEIILKESERLINLSSNLLWLSELDGQVIREKKSFSLDEQIRKTILILQPLWEKKNLKFNLELEEIQYTGYEDLLNQVWLNLIGNAVKFSNNNDTVNVTLRKWNDIVQIKVIDEGTGISKNDQDHIFDRFYKGDKSRSDNGNGLGLSIAKKIIEQSGGSITLLSETQKGTSVIVELPK